MRDESSEVPSLEEGDTTSMARVMTDEDDVTTAQTQSGGTEVRPATKSAPTITAATVALTMKSIHQKTSLNSYKRTS